MSRAGARLRAGIGRLRRSRLSPSGPSRDLPGAGRASSTGRETRRWRPHRWRPRRWRHWTLRSRLVVVVALLSAVALVAANGAGLLLLRRDLTGQVDDQLTLLSRPLSRANAPDWDPPTQRPRIFPRGAFGPDQVLLLYRPDGRLERRWTSDDQVSPPALPTYEQLVPQVGGRPYTVDSVDGDSSWRVVVVPYGTAGGIAVLAVSMRAVESTSDLLLAIDAGVTLLVLLLLGLVSAAVVRIGLRPLTRMERISAEIRAGDLSRRVADVDPHTEPGRLGGALNLMLNRIESEVAARTASERRLRQFVADASHELRTPLTSIRGFAELYRRGGAQPGPELDEAMSRIEAEAARMGLLVEDLLLLARLDVQRVPRRQPVDLLAIAADTIRDAHARAPGRSIRLVPLPGHERMEQVAVLGDEHRLRQVATNLVANAVQHTPARTKIVVRVGRLGGPRRPTRPVVAAVGFPIPDELSTAVLEVSDTGPGLVVEHADRVFERLYRADRSRSRGSGGSGLGLSIVAAIVTGHGGRVELETAPGRGTTFRVLLPEHQTPADEADGGVTPGVTEVGPAATERGADSQPTPR